MATLPRCLCLVLTLWMVSSRPSAAIGIESLDSGSWWHSEASKALEKAARQYWNTRNFSAAEQIYQQGYEEGARRHDTVAAERYLTSVAGCRFAQFRYRDALASYLQARSLAASIRDRQELGAIAVNLSSLYQQMWDLDSALLAAEEGRAAFAGLPKTRYHTQLLLQLGRLRQSVGTGRGANLFAQAIEASRADGDPTLEAQAWDLLGEQWLRQGAIVDAEKALSEAFRLRVLHARTDLSFSYARLGALKLAQGDLDTAAEFTGRAIRAGRAGRTALPEYLLKHQRGRILLARGKTQSALEDFGEAVDLASRWRLEILPAVSSLTGANAGLAKRVFDSFIETGAAEALRTGGERWAARTFQAVELNRAASLRESLVLADVWRNKLPAEYWQTLGQLRVEDARLIRAGSTESPQANRLKLKLTELEAEVGLSFPRNKIESFQSQTSLIQFQQGLRDSEVVLSFHLGESESYLWAVTRQRVSLHRLPPAKRLKEDVGGFRDAVRWGRGDAAELGERLNRELFGHLSAQQAGKHAWLLSLEDALFELPFAALVTKREGGNVEYLVERHSLQIVPGALLLRAAAGKQDGSSWFLGVGDPIYNSADPRWRGKGYSRLFARAAVDDGTGQLSRLVASRSEVDSSARSWRGHGATVLLQGAEARRTRFLELAAHEPAVIHLATHVLVPQGRRGQAFIAFGLNAKAEAEFLTTSDVARLRVPASLVVMTGCESGVGEILPGAGLLGLTRAWQMAGAGAVVAAGWPVQDSKGEIFASFYRYLREAPAAEALRRSQVEMVRSGTWRAVPGFWAPYRVTGGSR